ncbi:cytochrome P450 monooxygenase [Histoplasma capsulatum G186AR]|uniref:Cytochrome P450 monooxygenase n=1 Tax=Ajellomyces capsulatus TaxID=5037 RepID=A0A8H7Z123_AJECA|nr:cytochrome P450 monooxygenase [Histoplasma capsulatum]QSS67510.1 cytochrome P450 monooxygenase [Histoplasma capsulatum G186AR]
MAAISQAIICRHLLPVLQQNIQFQANVEVHGLINAIAMDFVPAYIFGLASGTNFLEDIPTARDWFRVYQSRKPFEFFYQVPRMTYLAKMLKIPLISKWSDKANQVMENWGLEMIDYAEKFLASTDPACEPVVYKQVKQSLLKKLTRDNLEVIEATASRVSLRDVDHLAANHETSAVALTYFHRELSRNPDLQGELRRIGDAFTKNNSPISP